MKFTERGKSQLYKNPRGLSEEGKIHGFNLPSNTAEMEPNFYFPKASQTQSPIKLRLANNAKSVLKTQPNFLPREKPRSKAYSLPMGRNPATPEKTNSPPISHSPSPAPLSLSHKKEEDLKINKTLYDKKVKLQKMAELSASLDYQIAYKEALKREAKASLETERNERINMSRLQREEELKIRAAQIQKAKDYKDELDRLHKLKDNNEKGKFTESAIKRNVLPQALPYHKSMHKKAPKTISYNPITGELRDVAVLNDSDHEQVFEEPGEQNDFTHVFLQHPLYTRRRPKYVPSFPVTGYTKKDIVVGNSVGNES